MSTRMVSIIVGGWRRVAMFSADIGAQSVCAETLWQSGLISSQELIEIAESNWFGGRNIQPRAATKQLASGAIAEIAIAEFEHPRQQMLGYVN